MTESGEDRELVNAMKVAIRQTVAALGAEAPDQELAGYALLTDDGLETLSFLAVTKADLQSSNDPDLLFTATDWPREPAPELFDSADAELRRRAEAATDFHVHVDVSYGLLVQALDESRAEGVFRPDVFLSALSTDPSKHLLALEDAAIRRLNESRLIQERERFLERWRRNGQAI